MEVNFRKSSNRKKGKKVNTVKSLLPNQEFIKEVENYSIKPVENQVMVSQLYNSLQSAVNDLLISITTECYIRISSIKKSTLRASKQITNLKNTLNEMLKNKNFSEASIKRLKDMSTEATFYYKPQSEEFNFFIDKVAREVKKSESSTNIPIEYLKASPDISCWGVVRNDGTIKEFPLWVNKQIDTGVRYGASEIHIYKANKLASIADVEKMAYYGFVKGCRLPGQELRRIR